MAAAAKPMLVGITAWLIPSRSYIEAAAKVLVPLCKQIDAASLVWDAETPWVKGTGMTHQDAAELVAQEFAELPCAMGMTGFPAVPKTATRPLTDVCSFGMPQAYSFWDAQHNRPGTNSVPLETGQKEWWATWQKNFVVGRTSPFLLVMGLASYQQTGLSSSVLDAMQTAVEASTAVGATNICYWQLKYFDPARNGANQQVYDAMRSITGAT